MENATELSWKLSTGHSIHGMLWKNTGSVKGVVGFTHGMGGHVGLYNPFVECFLSNGFHVIGFDQIGHGKSDGKRGDAPSLTAMVENMRCLVKKADELYPDLPVILFAHSMGANILLNYLLSNPTKKVIGAIASSPWIKLVNVPSTLKLRIGRFVARFHPSLPQRTGLDRQAISRDRKYLSEYLVDNLSHSRITLRFYFAARLGGIRILKRANKLNTPLLLYHGTGDRITSHKASMSFAEKVKNKSLLRFELLDGVYHEPHNDYGKELVFEMIGDWLNKLTENND